MNCNSSKIVAPAGVIGLLISVVVACSPAREEQPAASNAAPAYFSLKNYFRDEAERLQRASPKIVKSVVKNGSEESRHTQISNWENELMLFIESDINKPAWQQSYQIDSSGNTVVYQRLDPELRTVSISIERNADETIDHIRIQNGVENMLYTSEEQLDYYPDSLYRINKKQRVMVIGENSYTITGTLSPR